MLLDLDGGLNDGGVEGVGDERDDEVVLADLLLEGVRVGDIEGDRRGVLKAFGELLGGLERAAGYAVLAM